MASSETRDWKPGETVDVRAADRADPRGQGEIDDAAWGRSPGLTRTSDGEAAAERSDRRQPADDYRSQSEIDDAAWGRPQRQAMVESARVDYDRLRDAMVDDTLDETADAATAERLAAARENVNDAYVGRREPEPYEVLAARARGDQVREPGDDYAGMDALRDLPITDLREVDPDDHANGVYDATMLDGSHAFLKPQNEEDGDLRLESITPNSEWKREVAASDLDHLFGLDVVPETVARHEPELGMDHASLQAAVPGDGLPRDAYSERDQQAMAAFDYIAGNTDRHSDNHRTFENGGVAAIDNGLCFPTSAEAPIRSGFVADWFDRPLDDHVIEAISRPSDRDIAELLDRDALDARAVEGVLSRRAEVRDAGRITGDAWDGRIDFIDERRVLRTVRDRKGQL